MGSYAFAFMCTKEIKGEIANERLGKKWDSSWMGGCFMFLSQIF